MSCMKWVTIKKAAEISGYSAKAIEQKRANGVWLEGDVWIKAPDGRILVSPEGIDKWAEEQVSAAQARRPLKSVSSTVAFDAARSSG